MKKSSKGKVLVVDDDKISLDITRARLESAGYSVVTREQAIGTLMIISEEKPDIVLLDLNMPNIVGERFIGMIREHFAPNPIPVIFHSSLDMITLQQKAAIHGAIGAITKTANDDIFLVQFERLYDRVKRKSFL